MKHKLQANIQGYLGRPASLFGMFDTETGVLVIATAASKKLAPKDDCIFITNQLKTEHDFFIDESKLLDSISSYYRLKNGVAEDGQTSLLRFSAKAGNADPVSSIEVDGVSKSGMDYRIARDISNVQIATLAMCLYAESISTVEDTLAMFDELDELMEGNWVTI